MPISLTDNRNLISLRQAIPDTIMRRAGLPVEDPHERCRELADHRLIDLARLHLEAMGISTLDLTDRMVGKLVLSPRLLERHVGPMIDMLGASTDDFTGLLATSINKSFMYGYGATPVTWETWCRRTTARDLKPHVSTSINAPDLQLSVEGAEITFAQFGEATQTYSLAKYSRGFAITLEALTNDDLQALLGIPVSMGQAARRLEDDLVYETVFAANSAAGQTMSDSLSLFASGHGNVGSAAALSAVNVGITAALMGQQLRPGSDKKTGVFPRYLLTGSELAGTAQTIAAQASDPNNPDMPNRLVAVTEPRLSSVDANGWWLVASNTQIATAEVCFLEGEEAPRIVEMAGGFASDGRKFGVFHTVAAAAVDHRGFCKNAGA